MHAKRVNRQAGRQAGKHGRHDGKSRMTVGNYNEERIPWGKSGEPRGSNEVRAVARHHVPN